MADTHTYKFNVSMSCSGCSGAVDRVLKKLEGKPLVPITAPADSSPSHLSNVTCTERQMTERTHTEAPWLGTLIANQLSSPFTGVESYEVSLENQTATVVAKDDLPYEKVLSTIAKTGKKVNTGEADGVAQSVEVAAAA